MNDRFLLTYCSLVTEIMEFLDADEGDSVFKVSSKALDSAILSGEPTENLQFAYGVDLLRTSKPRHIANAVDIFEGLFNSATDEQFKRDCLFFIAVGCTKQAKYERAKQCCENILQVQPRNHQVVQLKNEINRRITRDGLTGLAAVGAAVAGVAAIIGLAVGLSRRN